MNVSETTSTEGLTIGRSARRLPVWSDPLSLVVVLIGLGFRLLWVAVGARPPKILADPALYYYSALQIACGRGYVSLGGPPCAKGDTPFPTSYYPPGYPLFLGAQQWLLRQLGQESHTVGVTGVTQAVLGTIAIIAVMIVGWRLGGRAIGLASGLVMACWPNLIVYSGLLLSETLFVAAFAVAVAGLLTMNDDGRWHWWRASVGAVSLGVASMVRPQVLLVIPAFGVAWLLGQIGWRQVLARLGVVAAGIAVVVTPWTIRNFAVFDAVIPFSTNGGDNLCVGFHPGAEGGFSIPKYCETGEFYTDGPAAERRRDAETRRRAIEWIKANPEKIPVLSLKKMWITYRTDTDGLYAAISFGKDQFLGDALGPLKVLAGSVYVVIMMAAAIGLVATARSGWRRRTTDATGLCIVGATLAGALVPVMFFGDPRFKMAVSPCFAVLAGAGFVALGSLLGRRRAAVADSSDLPPLEPDTHEHSTAS